MNIELNSNKDVGEGECADVGETQQETGLDI